MLQDTVDEELVQVCGSSVHSAATAHRRDNTVKARDIAIFGVQ